MSSTAACRAVGLAKAGSCSRVACAFLFFRERFPAPYDLRQAAQRTVYCFSIRKDFRYVRFQYDDITSPRIASRVFSADTF